MKKIFAALSLALTLFGAMAQDNWILISTSSGGKDDYYALKGSVVFTQNRSDEEIVVMTGKNDDKVNKRITLEKIYVRTSHCAAGQGKAVTVTMDGEFKYDFDFIFGAGSVGSTKAEFLCSVARMIKEERAKKGI